MSTPSIDEQQEICRRVDALLANADALELQHQLTTMPIERLSSAVLAKAFGKLVPQDPNDEPASALLARAASARQETETRPARRKKAG